MSPRFPLSEMPNHATSSDIDEKLQELHGGKPDFEWKDGDGSFLGPYAALSHSPIVLPAFWGMAKATYHPESVKPRNREVAVLGVCSIVHAPYIQYCHRPIFIKLGFTAEQYETGLAGKIPEGLNTEEAMAYELGKTLTELKGPLSQQHWEQAVSKMGRQQLLGVAHIVGAYVYISMLGNLNGEDHRWS